MTLLAAQLLYFSRLGVHESFWSPVPGMLLGGVGIPAVMAPASAAALSGSRRSGRRRLGGPQLLPPARRSIGVALMGAIMARKIGGRQTPQAFVHGLSGALEVPTDPAASNATAIAGGTRPA